MRGYSAVVAAALLLTGCGKPAELSAHDAWARLPATGGRPGVAYFTLQGGDRADTLLAVASPAALRAEMHETVNAQGVMAMRPVDTVAIPAGDTVAFSPGGRHVMLFDIGPNVKPGTRIPLALAFASGKRVEVQAQVLAPGDPAPGR